MLDAVKETKLGKYFIMFFLSETFKIVKFIEAKNRMAVSRV